MPHLRNRYVVSILRSGLKHKGIVGLFGHRQVGKTTVLEQLAPSYVTLDRSITLQQASDAPENFLAAHLSSRLPLAIDECQLAPPLFPALKEHVRTDKRPGIFLLSGSVRFSSRKAIRESLTGRMLSCELLPFSVSELRGKPMNTLSLDLLQSRGFRGFKLPSHRDHLITMRHAAQYLQRGGLPGICFVRNDRNRFDLLESQLDLILDRDLRLVCETSLPLSSLRKLLGHLAFLQNIPLNLSDLSRQVRISTPTLRKILSGLESIFFIRILSCEGNESSPVIFLEDQGEAYYLRSLRLPGQTEAPSHPVADLERLAFSHLRIPFAYTTGINWQITQYRQQGGAYVPFVIRSQNASLGCICMEESHPSLGATRSATSFLKKNRGAKLVYLHPGERAEVLNDRELVLPIAAIL